MSKTLKVVRSKSAIIHRIADCENCGWHDEDYKYANQRARRHSQKTGHKTAVENGNIYWYQPAEGETLVDKNQLSLI